MKIGKNFRLGKAFDKLSSSFPALRNERTRTTDMDLEIQRIEGCCESINTSWSAIKEDLDKRFSERKDKISRNNRKEEVFFGWMKTFLYLTEDYTIKNLESAYYSERYAENHNPLVKAETKKKEEDTSKTVFDIYKDIDINGLDDTKLKKSPSLQDSEILLIDRLSSRADSSRHSEMDMDENKDYENLKEYSPQDSFSLEYQVHFFKTLLCFVIDQYLSLEGWRYLKWEKDIYSELGKKCGVFQSHFEICLRMIGAYVHGLVGFDNSESLILTELRKYRFNNDYSAAELEQIRVFGQMLSLQTRLNYAVETGELKEKSNNEKENEAGALKEEKTETEVKAEDYEKEAIALMNYNLFLTYMSDAEAPVREMVEIGKRSLQIRDPKRQWRAFNHLAVYAVENVQRQLAYDVLYSWIKNCAVGEIKTCFPNGGALGKRLFPYKTDLRRDEENRASILGNFAYVCADIADTYEVGTYCHMKFRRMADKYIEKAVDTDNTSGDYRRTYGTLLSEKAEAEADLEKKKKLYWNAVEQYKLSYSAISEKEKMETLSGMFNILKEAFVNSAVENAEALKLLRSSETASCHLAYFSNNDFYVYLKKMITEVYPDKLKDSLETEEGKANYPSLYVIWRLEQYRKCWKTDKHLKNCGYGDTWLNEIECLLLILNELADNLKKNLKRRDYSGVHYFTREKDVTKNAPVEREKNDVIAYYTTLNNACYLFDELQKDSTGSVISHGEGKGGRNCLTAMNARYMNDPYEGLTLLKVLMKNPDSKQGIFEPNQSPAEVRDEIYKDRFIFLKSFTELKDNLAMWSRYASDYNSEGKGCNGCLIRLDTGEFGGAIYYNENRKSLDRLEKNEAEDEYYLYRVVYLTKEGKIKKEHNPDIARNEESFSRINRNYELLKMLIPMLDTTLAKIPPVFEEKEEKETFLREIRDYVRQSLSLIIFLFKGDEYADERESRIVFSRRPDQQDTIRVLPGTPAKLCVNPYFQIYVKSIMFGPNVRDEESWIPYLQYQLNRMWAKNPAVGEESGKKPQDMYTIEKSAIHYHT